MALDKVLKIYDENGNPVDYDILASDVKFLPDGKDLPTKLTEMEDAIEDAAEGGGYTPPQGGIPKTDLAPSVQTSLGLADTALQPADKTQLQNAINSLQSALDTLIGSGNVQGAIDTFNEVKAFLDGIDTDDPTLFNQLKSLSDAITALQTALAGKISGIRANGASTTLPVDQNGVVELPPAGSTISPATASPSMDGTANVGSSDKYAREDHVHPKDTSKLSKSDVSVETQGDGTVDINIKDDTYKINLNHTHEGMVKLEKYTEATMPNPEDMDDDTIYVQVDDATNPQAIEALHIFGLEFTGGSEDDGLPKMSTPKNGNTINMGTYSGSAMTKVITVRAKNLNYGGSTTGLTVEAVGTGLTLTYGQTTGTSVTIPQADAMIGAQLTINYSGTGVLSDGELRFKQGNSVLAVVVVVVEIPSELLQDTAWCAASGENLSAPETQAGYCTTPFYQLTHDANNYVDYIVKAGYVTPTGLAIGAFVAKKNLSDSTTKSAFLQYSDPRRRQTKDPLGNTNYLSATFKTSEWADCYIYDYIAGAYLFAGANVDTSTPPTMINPT